MPGGDGSGPWWQQGRWNCRRGPGSFSGCFFRGYGFSQVPRDQELSNLKAYSDQLSRELEAVKKRIAEMEKSVS